MSTYPIYALDSEARPWCDEFRGTHLRRVVFIYVDEVAGYLQMKTP